MTQALRLLSGGAAQGLVQALEPAFRERWGIGIDGSFGAVGAMRDRLLGGDPCDLLILSQALIEQLAASGHARRDAIVPLGVVKTGIALPAAAPDIALASAQDLQAALRSASAIHFPDPVQATAGIHFMKVLRQLGLQAELRERLRPHPNGATAMRAMAASQDPRAIGCTQVTEILMTPGVRLAALLPPQFELATVYTAAVCTQARQPDAARGLIDLLAAPQAAATRRAAGFEEAGA